MFMSPRNAFTTAAPIAPVAPSQVAARPMAGPARGLLSGTIVETAAGWRPVDALRAGDLVQTLDGGLRRVAGLRWQPVTPRGGLIVVPGGILGSESDIELLPDQEVLVDGDQLEQLFGLPAAMVRARDLLGFGGTVRRPTGVSVEACALSFDEEEVIWVNGGMCLHCTAGDDGDTAPFFETLSPAQARLWRLSAEPAPGMDMVLAA